MAANRLETGKKEKFIKTLLFLRRELNSNWLETLRIKWNNWESLLYLNRERLRPFIIQDMSYDYKKNDKYRQKLNFCTKNYARKRCPPNQLNINVITKNNENLRLDCLKVTTFVNQMRSIIVILRKENRNLQKRAKMQKSRKLVLWKQVVRRKNNNLRKLKTFWRANCVLIDKWCELYKETLSYNLTQIKLEDIKNLSLFFINNKHFQNS